MDFVAANLENCRLPFFISEYILLIRQYILGSLWRIKARIPSQESSQSLSSPSLHRTHGSVTIHSRTGSYNTCGNFNILNFYGKGSQPTFTDHSLDFIDKAHCTDENVAPNFRHFGTTSRK